MFVYLCKCGCIYYICICGYVIDICVYISIWNCILDGRYLYLNLYLELCVCFIYSSIFCVNKWTAPLSLQYKYQKYQYLNYAMVSLQSTPDDCIVHETQICATGEKGKKLLIYIIALLLYIDLYFISTST